MESCIDCDYIIRFEITEINIDEMRGAAQWIKI